VINHNSGDSRGKVFDLGYKPYEGERLGTRGAVRAVVRDGVRRILGIRRKARHKILPWMLFAVAMAPAAFFVAFSVLTGDLLGDDVEFFGPAQYFNYNASITLLFVAVAASQLLVSDRVDGTLQLYASRPLRIRDYLGARVGSLGIVAYLFLFIPPAILLIGQAAVSGDGFVSSLTDDSDLLWKTAVAALVFLVAYAAPAFIVASLAGKNAYVGGAIFVVLIFMSSGLAAAFVNAGFDLFGVLALEQHPRYVRDWIFGVSTAGDEGWIPEAAGFEPWVSMAVIVLVAVVGALIILQRYRRME